MKTPYDGYVRLKRQALDALRQSIANEVASLRMVEDSRVALAEEVATECVTAQHDWTLSTYAYLRDRARRGARLALTQQEHEEQLDRLRRQAGEAYGGQRVAEKAALAWTQRVERERAQRTQAEADDLSSARMLLRLRREKLAQGRMKTLARASHDRSD